MAESTEVSAKLFDAILAALDSHTTPSDLLKLSEAYAWGIRPNVPHGGSAVVAK